MMELVILLFSVIALLIVVDKLSQKSELMALVLFITSICSCLIIFQNRIFYMPVIPLISHLPSGNPKGFRHPSEINLNTKNISILTEDQVLIRGWLIHKNNSQRLIVYFHENAGNLGIRIPYIQHIHHRTNSDVLLIAYRGFSESEGRPDEKGLQKDAKAILDYAVKHRQSQIDKKTKYDIYVLGRSMGGAVAIYSSTLVEFSSVISGYILENTFSSIADMLDSIFPPLRWCEFAFVSKWPSNERIRNISLPILFVRSLLDETVPTTQMVKLIDQAKSSQLKKEFVIANGSHNIWWQYDIEGYFNNIVMFFEQVSQTSK